MAPAAGRKVSPGIQLPASSSSSSSCRDQLERSGVHDPSQTGANSLLLAANAAAKDKPACTKKIIASKLKLESPFHICFNEQHELLLQGMT